MINGRSIKSIEAAPANSITTLRVTPGKIGASAGGVCNAPGYGDTVHLDIPFGGGDGFEFPVQAGDRPVIRALSTGVAIEPLVFASLDGSPVCSGGGGGVFTAFDCAPLFADGVLDIQVFDQGDDAAGPVDVYINNLIGPANTLPIVAGEVEEGNVDAVAIDFYEFLVTLAGIYTVDLDTGFDSLLDLYDEDGNLIASGEGLLTEILDPGTYRVGVSTSEGTAGGDYALTVDALEELSPDTPLAGSLVAGETRRFSLDTGGLAAAIDAAMQAEFASQIRFLDFSLNEIGSNSASAGSTAEVFGLLFDGEVGVLEVSGQTLSDSGGFTVQFRDQAALSCG